jgi:hypothetical protein
MMFFLILDILEDNIMYTKNVELNLTPPCVPTYGEDIFFKNL